MSVYIIAQLKFTRRELYDRYQSRFMGVFKKFKGKLLVADAHPVVLEGEWPRDKVVIMEFPDDAAAQEFQNSRRISGDEALSTVTAIRLAPTSRFRARHCCIPEHQRDRVSPDHSCAIAVVRRFARFGLMM